MGHECATTAATAGISETDGSPDDGAWAGLLSAQTASNHFQQPKSNSSSNGCEATLLCLQMTCSSVVAEAISAVAHLIVILPCTLF